MQFSIHFQDQSALMETRICTRFFRFSDEKTRFCKFHCRKTREGITSFGFVLRRKDGQKKRWSEQLEQSYLIQTSFMQLYDRVITKQLNFSCLTSRGAFCCYNVSRIVASIVLPLSIKYSIISREDDTRRCFCHFDAMQKRTNKVVNCHRKWMMRLRSSVFGRMVTSLERFWWL